MISNTVFEVTILEEENLTGKVLLRRGNVSLSICASLWDEIHAKAVCQEKGFR